MVQQIYTREVLEKFSINQLRETCDRLTISRRRSKEDCIVDILAAQPQLVAQAELEAHIEEQAQEISPLELNHQGYQDAVAGLPAASDNHSYSMGYDRGLRDIAPIPQEDKFSQAVAFDKVANTIYGGVWEANVNGFRVVIASVGGGGYKTNLTGYQLFLDFGEAIKESLLMVAKLQKQDEQPAFEVFATEQENIYACYSHKPNQPSKRYEVDLDKNSCTCPHYEHRHTQEGFQDKHIEIVKLSLQIRVTPLQLEKRVDEEGLIEKFRCEFPWIGNNKHVKAWLEFRFDDIKEAIASGKAKEMALQQERKMDEEILTW